MTIPRTTTPAPMTRPRFPLAAAADRPAHSHPFQEPGALAEVMAALLAEASDHGLPPEQGRDLADRLEEFGRRWRECFARFGHAPEGELSYRDLLLDFEETLAPRLRPWLQDGPGATALAALEPSRPAAAPKPIDRQWLVRRRRRAAGRGAECAPPEFDRPLFIVSAPRSGSTLLFETLSGFPDLWTTGEESHELIEGIPELHPAAHGYASNRLTAAAATPAVVAALRGRFARQLQDRAGRGYLELPEAERPSRVRFLEKTPKNILRIPFLRAAFPGARFLVLYRRPEETLASLIDGWRGPRFTAYRPLPGWPHRAWKFLLVPGWETLAHRPLAEIVAHQWRMAHETALADLRNLPPDAWRCVRYADLVREPAAVLRRLAGFAELAFDAAMASTLAAGLPLSSMTFSAPDPEKWRRHAAAIETVLPGLREVAARMEDLADSAPDPVGNEVASEI